MLFRSSEAVKPFEELGSDYITGNAPDRLDNAMGWDTGSLAALEARGAAAFGVRQNPGYTDENGAVVPTTYTGDLEGLAKQFNIDPSKFKDTYKTVETTDPETGAVTKTQVLSKSAQDKLYDAVNEATKDFYFIAGKTGKDAGGIGEKANGVTQTAAFTNPDVANYNHASVLYYRSGDKLIPIPETLKGYNSEMELEKGTWFTDTFGGIASIPFISEAVMLAMNAAAPGSGTAIYPYLKGAQTAALGGGFGDVGKSVGLSYLATQAPKVISPYVSSAVDGNPLLTNLGTGATIGAASSAITGKDVGGGALMGTAGAGLAYGANQLVPQQGLEFANELGIDPKYQSMFANTLARLTPTILTGGKVDPTKVLMSYLMSKGKEKIKEGTT